MNQTAKPSLARGTRDFGPAQMAKRNQIFSVIKRVFEKYGFSPMETPAMETLAVLTGKYGDEGDQLIFKILNSGDYLSELRKDTSVALSAMDSKKTLPLIAEKAMRYDLTVPFARYVSMNRGEITFPFKRYQIQPVWRADRPQKGRYREFYQCDADVVGTDSLICEAEIVLMIQEVLNGLGILDYSIKFNNRKILTGLTEAIGEKGKEGIICVAIDKLDKIGEQGVRDELLGKGIAETAIQQLLNILNEKAPENEIPIVLKTLLASSEIGLKGIEEVEKLLDKLKVFGYTGEHLQIDLSLARGLSYYTGAIFEVKVNNIAIGSIGGGGRYDNLTGVFGLQGVSGVGFSFGVDRIYDVMTELGLFKEDALSSVKAMIVHFDAATENEGLRLLTQLRASEINAEMYPEPAKLKKQFAYADAKGIPFVIVCGPDEIAQHICTIRQMKTGNQSSVPLEEVADYFGHL